MLAHRVLQALRVPLLGVGGWRNVPRDQFLDELMAQVA